MSLFEKLRARPEWEDADGAVRARAVRDLPPDDLDLLLRIAAEDEDPAVRGTAVQRIDDLEALLSIHGAEADPAVRAVACEALRDLLLDAEDEAGADAAVDVLAPRDLAALAREARHPGVSRAALSRLEGEKHLAAVASRAGHVEVAAAALERIVDPESLQTVAVKAEERSVALGAFERLSNGHLDPDWLAVVAKRSKQKAVARRAKALLAEHESARAMEQEPAAPEEGETARPPVLASPIEQVRVAEFDEERAKQAQRAEERSALLAAARRVCETIERVPGAEAARALPGLRDEWGALAWTAAASGPPKAQAALLERFERAVAGCEQRGLQWKEDQAQLERLEALVAEMERAELAEDGRPQAFWQQSDMDWRAIVAEFRGRSIVRRDSRERLIGLERRKAEVDARRRAAEAAQRSDAERQAQENLERIERLCATVEDVAASAKSQLPAAERQLRAARRALEELRESDAAAPLPSRRARAALVRRLQQAHTALLGRVRELRDFADWKRWANLGVREELCARLEALVDEQDDAAVASRYREIVLEWRRTADVPQDRDAPTRARFEAAHEKVYPRCQAFLEAQTAGREQNLARRIAIIEEAEQLASSTDWLKTAQRIATLKEQWQEIGPVPRQQQKETWNRFRTACNTFFRRRKEDLDTRKKAWVRNLELKEALIARVEALAADGNGTSPAEQVRQAQAEWKTIGPVQRKRSDAVWQRFRAACDAVYGRIHAAEHAEVAGKVAAREEICSELEALLPADGAAGEPPAQLAETVRDLRQRWRQAPEVPQVVGRRLAARFGGGVNRVIAAWPAAFRGSDLDPNRQLRRLEALCARAETLVRDDMEPSASPAEILAARWREALASNLMGARVDEARRRRSTLDEVRRLQAERRRLGQIPGAEAQRLAQRFQQACDRLSGASQAQRRAG